MPKPPFLSIEDHQTKKVTVINLKKLHDFADGSDKNIDLDEIRLVTRVFLEELESDIEFTGQTALN